MLFGSWPLPCRYAWISNCFEITTREPGTRAGTRCAHGTKSSKPTGRGSAKGQEKRADEGKQTGIWTIDAGTEYIGSHSFLFINLCPLLCIRSKERKRNLLPTETHVTQGNERMSVKNELELIHSVPAWIIQDCTCFGTSPLSCISVLFTYIPGPRDDETCLFT